MIKKKGIFSVIDGYVETNEVLDMIDTLPDGQYNILIYDNKKNRTLPQLKYLCGVVLHAISEQHPDHPSINAMYRYYEEKFAPTHICNINGQRFSYQDLKNEKAIEVNEVIGKIIHHATTQLGVVIPSVEDVKTPGSKEAYIEAYVEMWKNVINQ